MGPLRQVVATDFPPGQSHLFLSADTAAYVRRLQEISAANGFREGDPVLDLTGVGPGQSTRGARPLSIAWTLGGYPGSTDCLAAALPGETCEAIAGSWILTEPSSRDASTIRDRHYRRPRQCWWINSTRSIFPQMSIDCSNLCERPKRPEWRVRMRTE